MKSERQLESVAININLFAVFNAVVSAFCLLQITNAQSQANGEQFSCQGRPSGYYADVQSGCQIYHMCDTLGRQFSYSCPNTTLFQQRMLICDHWYMVNCSKSEVDFDANLLIGQREKPFVEDDDEHPYHRTPRPDLLAHPSVSEYNIVYRSGRAQARNQQNLIGGDSDSRDQPYFLPSHWSTAYKRPSSTNIPTTQKPIIPKDQRTKKPYYSKPQDSFSNIFNTNVGSLEPVQGQTQGLPLESEDNIHVNFKSDFKATTPVYPNVAPAEVPLIEDDYSLNKPKVVLVAPPVVASEKTSYQVPILPSYPSEIHINDQSTVRVNFASNFKATTPVYPTFVTSEEPLANVDLPPLPNLPYGLSSIVEAPKTINDLVYKQPSQLQPLPSIDSQPKVNFASNFKATTPVYPTSVTPETPIAIEETQVDPNKLSLSTVIQPPRDYHQNEQNTLIEPSLFFQPPVISSKHQKDENEIQEHLETRYPFVSPNDARVVIANLNWKQLRRALFIPDVQFPLDASARRPTYEKGPSSFQVNPVYEIRQRKHVYNK